MRTNGFVCLECGSTIVGMWSDSPSSVDHQCPACHSELPDNIAPGYFLTGKKGYLVELIKTSNAAVPA